MLILLAGACLAWIGLFSLAFLALTGLGVSTAWFVAGALFFSLTVWTLVMACEFRNAPASASPKPAEVEDFVTGPLPKRARSYTYRLRYMRPTLGQLPRFSRTRIKLEDRPAER